MIINAILIPLIREEISLLKMWLLECPKPGFPASLFLAIDGVWTKSEKSELETIVKQSAMKSCQIEFIDCEIAPELSFYSKDKSVSTFDPDLYMYGKKSGPNIQFFTALRKICRRGDNTISVLLLETDAHPLKSEWLLKLNERFHWIGENIYVIGSKPLFSDVFGPISQHINGNAIYHTNCGEFLEVLIFWEDTLLEALQINPDLAYDVALEWSFNMSTILTTNVDLSHRWKTSLGLKIRKGFIDASRYIANLGYVSTNHEKLMEVCSFLKHNSQLLIAHGKILNSGGEDIIRLKKLGLDFETHKNDAEL